MEIRSQFRSARLKVERAKRHVMEAELCLCEFASGKFHRVVSKFNERRNYYELGLEVDPIPDEFQLSVGDAIHNLRSALDHVVYGIAPSSRTGFPFHEKREDVERILSERSIRSAAPCLVPVILDEIRPYRSGDRQIWILNKLDNIDKHRFIIASYSKIKLSGVSAESESVTIRDQEFIKDGPGFLSGVASDLPYDVTSCGKATITVSLVEKSIDLDDPAIPVLHTLIDLVANVIDVIDRHVAISEGS